MRSNEPTSILSAMRRRLGAPRNPFTRERIPARAGALRAPRHLHAAVVGGGLAGVAAATILAERGVRVTVIEREPVLGGRVGAWPDKLSSGAPFEMERGFHAFFRNYYNLRALLRRVDPELRRLVRLDDYPILGPDGAMESFADLPAFAPFNVLRLLSRTSTVDKRDLLRLNYPAAISMLTFDMERTYASFDRLTAKQYLDSLRFPPKARRMLFDVFAHSFFNPEEEMSAGELLMMFHFYFVGNPEGLIFDVLDAPFSTAVWQPFARYLEKIGATLLLGRAAARIEPRAEGGYRVALEGAESPIEADAVVLALTVPALQRVVAASPGLDSAPLRSSVEGLSLTAPFAVWRLWLDRPAAPGRVAFAGTTGIGALDNISLYHLFEGESRRWAEASGGSVVELHAYGLEGHETDEAWIKADLLRGLHRCYPELVGARVVDERFLLRRDCPSFSAGSHAARPEVATALPGLALAGDFVRLPLPTALMERATTAGVLAANHLLAGFGVQGEDVWSVPRRGIFAGMR